MNAEAILLNKKETPKKRLIDDVMLQVERGIEDIKAGRISVFRPSTKKR